MSSTLSQPVEPALGPSAVIDTDLPCAECGYNLRTLRYAADCPECGMAVVVSARGDRLAAAPVDWLRAVRSGAWWLRASVILALPIVYLGVPFSAFGVWRLTAEQPGRSEPSLDRGYRVSARSAAVLGALSITVLILGALATVTFTDQRFFSDWTMKLNSGLPGSHGGVMDRLPAFDALFLVAHAIYVLGLLSTWRYMGVLAQRVPNGELAKDCRRLGFAWLGAVTVLAVASGSAYLLIQAGIVPGGSSALWVPGVVGLLYAAVLLWLWAGTCRVSGRLVSVLAGIR